jgi:hypothetical protein
MKQDVTTTLNLQQTWELAYNGFLVFDFSSYQNPVIVCQRYWNDLCSYRRKVRLQKLNPLYTLEWLRISQTKITRVGLTSFTMTKRVSHLVDNRKIAITKRLPSNTLTIPTTVQSIN